MKIIIILLIMTNIMLLAINLLETYEFTKNIKIFTFFLIPVIFVALIFYQNGSSNLGNFLNIYND